MVITENLLQLAAQAQSELGLRLSTVDIIEKQDGEYQVLEINDSIMMEHYARHSPNNKQRVEEAYRAIVETMMGEG